MRSHLIASVAACLVAAVVPRIAAAQNTVPAATRANEDTVTLKDGSILRGTLTQIAKGAHVSLLLSTSQTAQIRWDAIAKVERAGVPIDLVNVQPTAVAVNPPPAVSATPSASGNVFVHMDASRDDLELEMDSGGAMNWEVVCTAPCDREVPTGRIYRINGSGVRKSKPFALQVPAGSRVTLTVDHGTTAGFVGGIILTTLGSPIVFIGALVTLAGAAYTGNGSGAIVAGGLVVTGVGAALMVPGIVLVANNSGTTVKESTGRPAQGDAGSVMRTAELPSRTPTWHSMEGPKNPAAPSVPIFSMSF